MHFYCNRLASKEKHYAEAGNAAAKKYWWRLDRCLIMHLLPNAQICMSALRLPQKSALFCGKLHFHEGVMSFMDSDDDKIIIEPPNSMNTHAKKTVTNTFHTTVSKDVSLAAPKDNEALNTGQGHQTGIATRQMVCVFSFRFIRLVVF